MSDPMHDNHDLDLIAALAEGRADESGRAAELVATCPDCAAAFSSHRVVLEAIDREPPVEITDLERHRLHAAVWDGIRQEAPQRRSTPWWYRVAPVAAVLVVAVGVLSQLDSIGSGDGAGSTTAADSPVDAFQSVAGEAEATTMAADTDSKEAPAGDARRDETNTESVQPETMTGSGAAGLISPEALAAAAKGYETSTAMTAEIPAGAAACIEADLDREDTGRPISATSAEIEAAPVWIVAFGAEAEVSSVRIYRDPTCELLYPPDH